MMAPRDARIVVIRHRSKYSGTVDVLAWWLCDKDDQAIVRRRMGGMAGGYQPRLARVPSGDVLRDATARERTLGRADMGHG